MIHPLHNYDGHMNTSTGLKFNIFEPKPEQINIIDISHGLSFKGHFCGQLKKYFSIAQHCLLVTDLLPFRWQRKKEILLAALLHDAAETYIGDMIKPIKIHFPKFKEIEDNIIKVISEVFKFNLKYLETIKKYDKQAQEIEFNTFYKNENHFNYLSPDQAHYCFMDKYYDIINL